MSGIKNAREPETTGDRKWRNAEIPALKRIGDGDGAFGLMQQCRREGDI